MDSELSLLSNANAFSHFNSSKYSDAVIRCGGHKFEVHRVVLCAQSRYFSNMFDGDWKAGLSTGYMVSSFGINPH